MGRGMAQDIQSIVIVYRNELDRCIGFDGTAQVQQLIVDFHGHAVSGKSFGNAFCHIHAGGEIFKLLYTVVWKCYGNHLDFPLYLIGFGYKDKDFK
jgi:hypothetical protein